MGTKNKSLWIGSKDIQAIIPVTAEKFHAPSLQIKS